MLSALPLIGGLLVILLLLVAAFALLPAKKKEQFSTALVPQIVHAPEPMRIRSQFDVETDEDLAVINDVYREQRKAERARQALERLAPLVPSGKK